MGSGPEGVARHLPVGARRCSRRPAVPDHSVDSDYSLAAVLKPARPHNMRSVEA